MSDATPEFTPEEIELLRAVVDEAAIAILRHHRRDPAGYPKHWDMYRAMQLTLLWHKLNPDRSIAEIDERVLRRRARLREIGHRLRRGLAESYTIGGITFTLKTRHAPPPPE